MHTGSQMHYQQYHRIWWMWTYASEHQVYTQFSVLYEQIHAHGWRFFNKKVYYELENLTQQGFDTWVGALRKISESQQLNLHMYPYKFHQQCQDIVRSKIIQEWAADIADTSKHPILRTYRYIKSSFRTEPYLYLVDDKRAISQLRCSSHILNVEKGRYTRPRTPLDERLCNMCNCVDDELHLITACAVNVNERRALYNKLIDKFPEFGHLCYLEEKRIVVYLRWCSNVVMAWQVPV